MNSLHDYDDHILTSTPRNTEDIVAENVVMSRKLCDTEPSSLTITKTPNRPLVENVKTPNAAYG